MTQQAGGKIDEVVRPPKSIDLNNLFRAELYPVRSARAPTQADRLRNPTSHPIAMTPSTPDSAKDGFNPQPRSAANPTAGPAPSDVLSALNELLEAERAGAWVATEIERKITAPELASVVHDIREDEVCWSGMLIRLIAAMGGTASSDTGPFQGKTMDISDMEDRLRYLNRAQAWVVRKLRAVMPLITDASFHAGLSDMLQAHLLNIRRVEALFTPIHSVAQAAPWEPVALIEHILTRFHEFHRQQLPELVRLAAKVEAAHAGHAELPRGLTTLLDALHAELLAHMEKEETILFPMLARGGNPFAVHPIAVMRAEHDVHTARVAQILALTGNGTPPDDACATWRQLSIGLKEFTEDLQQHVRLENDVLFPPFEPGKG